MEFETHTDPTHPTDPVEQMHLFIASVRAAGKPFAVATVIRIEGSASARTGSKAVFNDQGRNLRGWVGGGCAERFVGEQVVEALKENKTRIVLADMDDEILGLGVACGGKMHIFIEPILPAETIRLPRLENLESDVHHLASAYGWNVQWNAGSSTLSKPADLFPLLALTVAQKRQKTGQSMRLHKRADSSPKLEKKKVSIVGRSRITEALARHFSLAGFEVRAVAPALQKEDYPSTVRCDCLDAYQDIEFTNGETVIIASHTAQDPALVQKALDSKAAYVGMIGSQKRVHEVQKHLGWSEEQMQMAPLFLPVGLDIGARNPEEIALSVVAEVVQGISQ